MKPVHHSRNAVADQPPGQDGSGDQYHRQAKFAGGHKFGRCPRSTGVFGNDSVDLVKAQQVQIVIFRKRPARNHQRGVGQRQGAIRRVDQAHQILVLRLGREVRQVLATDGQKNPPRRAGQGGSRRRNVRHMDPAITRFRGPGGSFQRDQGGGGFTCGLDRMAAYLSRKRVGRVDQVGDLFAGQILGQPGHPAKSTGPNRDRLPGGVGDATGIRQRGGQTGLMDCHGQQARLGRAAKDQDVGHG